MKYLYLLYIYIVFPLIFLGLAKHKVLTLSGMGYLTPAVFIVVSAFFPAIFHVISRVAISSGNCKIRFGFLSKLAVFLLSVACSLTVFEWSPGAYVLQCDLINDTIVDVRGNGFYAVDKNLYIDVKVGIEAFLAASVAKDITVKDCMVL